MITIQVSKKSAARIIKCPGNVLAAQVFLTPDF
jgi:hypothetical protein